MTHTGLVATTTCPICGARDRDACDGMAARKTSGYHYLKHAAPQLNCSVEELVEQLSVYKCKTCGSFYCDPWLSPELASKVFCVGAPDHIAGWANFEHWLSSATPNSVEVQNKLLYEWISGQIGAFHSYAEFGCPFQGFLLSMKGACTVPADRMRIFSRALHRAPDVRWTKVTRLYHWMDGWAKRLAVAYLRIRSWKERIAQTSTLHLISAPPMRRVFLTEGTTRGWGSNCVRYGASCQYFAQTVLDADVIPLSEALANPAYRFDLLGVFNNLDHTHEPLEVVRKALRLAPHVLIATHRASHAGRQHLYGFGDQFADYLNQALPGATARDLARENGLDQLSKEYSYILVSKIGNSESGS